MEKLDDLLLNLAEAESEAYAANFVSFSSAKGTPEQYYAKSKTAALRALDDWRHLEAMLGQ